MKANRGQMPTEAAGKRVRGVLACGQRFGFEDKGAAPGGWAANSSRWSLTGHPFDIKEYEVIA